MDLIKGYTLAVSSSVGSALALRKLFSSVTKNLVGSKLIMINSLIAAIASGGAGFLNTFFMRQAEIN